MWLNKSQHQSVSTNRCVMTNTFRTTWITILSIVAMLMSSYVSSAPAMMNNMVSPAANLHHSSAQPNTTMMVGCDTVVANVEHAQHAKTSPPETSSHCTTPLDDTYNCCSSVCSSVCFPLQVSQASRDFTFSLALHSPIIIGDKVTRSQSILRPPSI